MAKQEIMLTAWSLIQLFRAAAEYLRCVTVVGNDTDLIVLLLHNKNDVGGVEHSTAVLPHQEGKWD